MANLKELSKRQEPLTGGHRLCPGCGASIVVRQVLLASKDPVVVVSATGCLEVSTTIFPYAAWKVPFLHNAFENAAATMSGVEAYYQFLKRKGKTSQHINFVAFGGDGGTYDIGLQSLSGAMERGHDFTYVCYNNQAYMNTGIQRSSATPKGANTTTEPAGKVKQGKTMSRKDLTEIMVAHDLPYVAQATVGNWADLTRKAEKAFSIRGPKFMNVLQPCRLGWAYKPEDTAAIGRIAAETCFWPLYEVENGIYKITKPREKKPVAEFLKTQERFRHLFKPGNEKIIEDIQADVDRRWQALLAKEEMTAKAAK
ncbi:pyruvate ferredoxin oxidoreductase [candidate division WOR-1 bacterium RIFOXYA12_FULL_52_29]|uniref:Pyruvate ferredoxin oxidoreductase n=1 Tax=candidate division WOR-1 bacterium RIFOXYC12_FULL_54_18 TaxID=1802584 RepID=A0A1F4T7R6_UNCSA|nr:MAG: pyruvate ferredoxin oxidoreductase [candidate division WOR-1 bacterium RIFOXYA2_FULL_51_19]OGC18341.1 MAG: pyruvate ferredoxin oxidoreductase [candidate division WOR-1 bacterium RIFOXYA12_FULL_52_29]OGC27196.1 MAG: pyruvate ferredoxin oxidoreductase [candidate division WOR-1 bacterium RIFOXYB2_FULL_45_9]OGC28758.1 MAG: pyruvate ferredoxin oxidoreductase [candidate division WOR-1 bacterium RIFOXYC12_FULL_54_18]OGC30787.1 MAG: pyruvate ferredoxin oxidoreductase [candidate division WOR-1 b